MIHPSSAGSTKPLISSQVENKGFSSDGLFFRDPSAISTNDVNLPKLLEQDGKVEEQTLMQVEIVNEKFSRQATRSQLASKGTCLTRRWQTAAIAATIVLALGGAIGGLAYWLSLPKVITQPYLLHGESCYMNSRSCDATRMLWCPAGTCTCVGEGFAWNTTIQNCSCAAETFWTGVKCQSYGSFGDPCDSIPCKSKLTCMKVVNQTYSIPIKICICDNTTYLDTTSKVCEPRLGYTRPCKTKFDCQDWLGLSCTNTSSGTQCLCKSRSYWNGATCANNALGGEFCSVSVPCDTTRGLSCNSSICVCNQYNYWDNLTTFECQPKKTYAAPCTYDFQCNTTIGLSCPSNGTNCQCPSGSTGGMCDCQYGQFWDGQRCSPRHTFNGTCPGQYACLSNSTLVCFLGHCICPGNQLWNNMVPNDCACPFNTTWNSLISTCA